MKKPYPWKSGDLDKALVSYLKAQELAPQDTEIAYRTACALLQAGYLEEAQSQLRRIVFAEPDHLSARASLGNCQLLLGDLANAKQNFAEVLEQTPDNRNALYGFASVLLKEDMTADAEVPVRRLMGLLPESPAVLSLFAEIQAKSDQSTAAIAAYRKALKAAPDYVPALLGLSEILIRRKRFDEIIELTLRASQLTPADPLPLELMSDALSGKGALEDAYEAAEEALKRNPRSVPVLVRLSVLARKLGRPAAGLKFALTGYDLDNKAQGPLNALGAALAAQKHANQARSVLTALSAGKSLDPEIRRFVENLISAEAGKPRTEPVSAEVKPAADEERPQEKAPVEKPEKDRSEAATQETGSADKKPQPDPEASSDAQGQIPNVLGLQRQDKS
ncbi:tetratricopeptide repeat protein [Roseibium salinum]|uniref:tetratricopeptide repeat protein n=1 Tax=Roseibium salinum TaxID=1604349 RepID=UPI00360E17DB